MEAGSIGHQMLDAYHRGESSVEANRFARNWTPPPNAPAYLDGEHMEAVVAGYMDHWKDSPLSALVDDDGVVLSECEYTVVLPTGVPFKLVIDLVAEYEGRFVIMDHKFTFGRISSNNVMRELSYQLALYLVAARQVFGDRIDIDAAMFNEISAGHNALKQPGFSRARVVDSTDSRLDEALDWITNVWNRRELKVWNERYADAWLMNPHWGCNYCEYNALCMLPSALRQRRIEDDYNQ
jgi:hypothetical protein